MLFSVITPTRDRAHTLPDLYASLRDQDADLEWIVVDDGSVDGTRDLVLGLAAPFPVRYLRQEPRGKHAAVNRGVAAARGVFAALADSDDLLLPGALTALHAACPDSPMFAGVTGRCVTERGEVLGTGGPVDCTWAQARYRHRLTGERWGVQRLEVLRRHPFPEGGFVPESAVWRAIGRDHLTRYVDTPVRLYRTGGTDTLSRRPFPDVAAGLREEHLRVLRDDIGHWAWNRPAFLRSALHYARAGLHAGPGAAGQWRDLENPRARLLYAAALGPAALLYARDRSRLRAFR